ncbi:MAG: hypothetical protein L0215_24970 [Gemmataceae bacterium]|nr:hypothetical protein [Gemmataceae bacterium]
MEDLRIRLIERLCRWPAGLLPEVESVLNRLERMAHAANNAITADPKVGLPAEKDWPHAPLHRLSDHGTYIVTASTLGKAHHFRGPEKLTLVESELLRLAKQFDVVLEAWAVFSNHYHFVAHTTTDVNPLANLIAHLHSNTATIVNRQDGTPGRQVWFNFWETQLTFEKSYFARLNYVHQNAVKHRLTTVASQYPWCSAAWFERTATSAQVKTIYSFKFDRLKIADDYDPVM